MLRFQRYREGVFFTLLSASSLQSVLMFDTMAASSDAGTLATPLMFIRLTFTEGLLIVPVLAMVRPCIFLTSQRSSVGSIVNKVLWLSEHSFLTHTQLPHFASAAHLQARIVISTWSLAALYANVSTADVWNWESRAILRLCSSRQVALCVLMCLACLPPRVLPGIDI